MSNQEVLLKVEHLCQYFKGVKAVDDVSFDVKRGEVFGLVGESGCGKTTTGRSIIKLYNITGGDIYFKGRRIAAGTKFYREAIAAAKAERKGASPERAAELKQIIARKREELKAARIDHANCDKNYAREKLAELDKRYAEKLAAAETADERKSLRAAYTYERNMAKKQRFVTQIQMIFQDPIASLDPRMTVYETIAEGLRIRGEKDKAVIDEKVYRVLELVGLVREHATRYPHEFSGGQRQRIGVARAVVMNPEMIIADEPVSALDVSIQAQVINLLNDLKEEMGLTVLFIAHNLSVVKYFCDRIGVMYFGKLVEVAPGEELYKNPLHPYTKALLSAIPEPNPITERQRKRIDYVPERDHDYSVEQPSMQEVSPGHFCYCSPSELEKYRASLK